jgi:hypothetical protein
MHSSGWIRIVAIVVGAAVMCWLRLALGMAWYLYVPLGSLAFVATPILIGVWLGVCERRRWAREIRLRENAMRSKLGRNLTPAEMISAIRPVEEPPPAATVEPARPPDGSTN